MYPSRRSSSATRVRDPRSLRLLLLDQRLVLPFKRVVSLTRQSDQDQQVLTGRGGVAGFISGHRQRMPAPART
ncbi:hypothetical protein [Streptomyces sp. 2A115]|uniref:hypothetical protein n=1 Tax=Streptomyces sp. 2A115 TaxID=3457439 RepID=UPI003FD0F047